MPESSLKTNSSAPIIRVEDLKVKFGTHTILSDVSFEIAHGEIAAIIGPNGSGKTTLIRAMLGLIEIAHGRVLFDGQPLAQMRTRIGYLPQRFRFDPTFPINVKEYLELSNGSHTHESLKSKLEEVGLPTSVLKKKLGSLSGGQLQRALIAQATLHHPAILILDEPSTGIDIVGEKQFYDLIESQQKHHGTTVMLVSHDIAVIAKVVDKVICINKRLVCFGPPKTALTQETLSELYGHNSHSLYSHHH
jgi:ABC-type Mn2+/Zn2+ transport system ATPase subunit